VFALGAKIFSIADDNMSEASLTDVVHKLRGPVGAPVTMTVLRPSQGHELVVAMKRSRIIPTTVTYQRQGNIALIHLTGFNSATTETLVQSLDKARTEIGRDLVGVI